MCLRPISRSYRSVTTRREEQLHEQGLPLYVANAPGVGNMTATAFAISSRHNSRFLLVVEEEGPDNFINTSNAGGIPV